ncbi:phospholipase A1-II 3-like [Panicum miliaceum]|uniref:Phospholipase A1 n=1 Tax=Panicum miliaceum TaxID=4540 RepID=A0A3L6SLL4_PANMI|nr:phospholipase A1-II 3-like [Panicum miliaceum]
MQSTLQHALPFTCPHSTQTQLHKSAGDTQFNQKLQAQVSKMHRPLFLLLVCALAATSLSADTAIAAQSQRSWAELSGRDNWEGLLDPLDADLRRAIIRYGELAQATSDAFIADPASPYAGASLYAPGAFLRRAQAGPDPGAYYRVTRFLYGDVGRPPPRRPPDAAGAAGGVERRVQLDGVRGRGHGRRRGGAREAGHRGGVARDEARRGVGRRPGHHAGARGGRRRAGARVVAAGGAPGLPVRLHVQEFHVAVQQTERQGAGVGRDQEASGRVQGRELQHHADRPRSRRSPPSTSSATASTSAAPTTRCPWRPSSSAAPAWATTSSGRRSSRRPARGCSASGTRPTSCPPSCRPPSTRTWARSCCWTRASRRTSRGPARAPPRGTTSSATCTASRARRAPATAPGSAWRWSATWRW